jgi:hypothetical protein
MNMSLTVKDNGSDFLPPPEGLHIARCYAVIDLGMQINKAFGNTSPKVLIGWELSNTLMPDGKPFIQMQSYTASISPNSKLRGLLEAWRGKGFTPAELQGFQLQSILGAPCYLTIKHTPNPQASQPWANVISICTLPSSVTCPPAINPPIYFDLDNYSEAAYLSLSEGIRKKINLEDVKGAKQAATRVVTDAALEGIDQDVPF